MPGILFAPLGSFISHLTRCLTIADELKARGHRIAFMSAEPDQAFLAKLGYETFAVYDIPHEDIVAYGAPIDYQEKFLGDRYAVLSEKNYQTDRMVADDLRVYAEFSPDIVIVDGRLTANLTTRMSDIPSYQIVNLTGYFGNGFDYRDACGGSSGNIHRPPTIEAVLEEEIRKIMGANPHVFRKRVQEPQPIIIPGIPGFETLRNLGVMNSPAHCFTGPLYWNGWKEMPQPDKSSYADKKIMLVTLGSSFPFAGVLKHIIEIASTLNYHAIINTGNQFLIDSNRDGSGGFEVLPYVDLAGFLAISDVAVCHGGHGTVLEILRAGVPSVTIPFNGDQVEVARRMAELKCGAVIEKYPGEITLEDLAHALTDACGNDEYLRNATRFKSELARWNGGGRKAADFVESHFEECQRKKIMRKAFANMKSELMPEQR